MLGLADYGSSDEDDTPTTTTTTTTAINKNNTATTGTQNKKRVINVNLPLAFRSKGEDDDEEEEDERPIKKANTGLSSLSSMLPAPKSSATVADKKKPTPTNNDNKANSATKVKAPVIRHPRYQLHKSNNANNASPDEEKEEEEEEIDGNDFFPIAAAAAQPVRIAPASLPQQEKPTPTQTQSQSQPQQIQQQQQTSYSGQQQAYPEYDEQAYYAQQQAYYDQQAAYYQQQHYQATNAASSTNSYTQDLLNDPSMQQGIQNPYQGRSKREMQMDSFGTNIVEVNQKDILKTNRPVHSENARLNELRQAKMSISAPKPTKLQRSRHQLMAMVYDAKQKEIESQEREILYRGH